MAKRILACMALALVLGWAVAAAPAAAAEPVLGLVPSDALGFVVVKDIASADKALVSLGKRMQLPVPSPLAQIKKEADISAGLDENGDALLVAFADKDLDRPPVVVLAVPVSDYAAFIKQFEPEDPQAKITEVTVMNAGFLAGEKAGYAVLAEPKHRSTLEELLENRKGPPAEVKSLGEWLDGNDVSLVVTRRGVELISEKIQEGIREARQTFEMLEGMQQDNEQAFQGLEMIKLVFGMYEQIAASMGKEVATISIGTRFDAEGALVGRARLQAVEGGVLARATQEVKLPVDNLLAGLPAGPYVIAGAGAVPEALVEPMAQFSAAVVKAAPGLYGVPADKADKLAELNTVAMKGFRGMSMSMGTGKPGDPIYGNLAGAIFVDDAEAYLDRYRESIDAIKELVGDNEKSIFAGMKAEQVEIDGKKVLRLEMSFANVFPVDANPEMARLFEVMYGPGGKMAFFMAVAGEKTVAFGSTEELLKGAIESAGGAKSLSADEALQKTAARLPAGAQWVGYFSPQGTVELINRAIPALAPPGAPKITLPAFPDTPPVGYAAKAAGGRIDLEMVVPPKLLESVTGYFMRVQMQIMQQQQQQAVPEEI